MHVSFYWDKRQINGGNLNKRLNCNTGCAPLKKLTKIEIKTQQSAQNEDCKTTTVLCMVSDQNN